ncbi:MAG: hypothetical protein H0T62_01980 [Parachlamydiaceae bacterium]|nr:hypothetical protein [Parachlamydiaceae bacterium]
MEASFSTYPFNCIGTPSEKNDLVRKNIAVTFDNVIKEYFDQEFLLKIPYFKSIMENSNLIYGNISFNVCHFSKSDIDLILSLFYDMRHLADAVDKQYLVDPDFYTHLEKSIIFFLQKEALTGKTIIAEEMQSFSFKVSIELLTNYFKKNKPSQSMPFFIVVAQKVVGLSLGYKQISFYEKQLKAIRSCQDDILNTWTQKNLIKKMLSIKEDDPLGDFLKKTIYMQTSEKGGLNCAFDLFKQCEARESTNLLQFGFDLSNIHREACIQLTPSKLLALASNSNSEEDSDLTTMCQKAMAKVAFKIYEANVYLTLQYQKRATLMPKREFLYAPLFAYYDMEPKSDFSGFQHTMFKTTFFYQFTYPKNANLMSLEKEIRDDLERCAGKKDLWQNEFKGGIPLPSPMFSEVSNLPLVPKKNISSEIKELREGMLPYFSHCRNGSEHNIIAQRLLEYWGWKEYGITPNDLTFIPLTSRFGRTITDEDNGFIRATIKLRNENSNNYITKKYELFFSIDDFKPIILHPSIDATFESSNQFMRDQWLMKKASAKENALLDFNFFDYIGLQKTTHPFPRYC